MHFAISFSFTVVGRIASRDGVGIGRLLSVPTPGSLPLTCADRLLGSGCRRCPPHNGGHAFRQLAVIWPDVGVAFEPDDGLS